MKVIKKQNGYTVEFNGSSTYFVTNCHNDCIFTTNTARKANNFLNRLFKDMGV
jgi:hypothetical protein